MRLLFCDMQYKHYFFIQCIEALAYQGKEAEWQSCFAETSLEPQPLFDCYNQGIGRRLELQYAYETAQLNPPHLYVPWVLVNNQPLHGDYRNFISYICKAYKGSSVPTVCNSVQFEINSFKEEKIDATKQGCFEGEQKNLTLFEPTKIPHQSMRVFTGGSNKR
uniref:Ribonuclease T(2) n=1 Tax=Opuntia streptacantha TaxID=393608 RepID=A0A7C9DA21_OPUST